MNAKFRIAGDLAIHLESQPHGHGVNVTIYRGVCYEHKPGEECKEVEATTLVFAKGEARAIASAMMMSVPSGR